MKSREDVGGAGPAVAGAVTDAMRVEGLPRFEPLPVKREEAETISY